jgi:hypothetical protein
VTQQEDPKPSGILSAGFRTPNNQSANKPAPLNSMQKQTTFRETDLSLAQQMVFSYLLLYAQGVRLAQRSKNEIAQTTRLSVEKVSVALKKLEALGLLHVHQTPGEANIYFCYPPRGSFASAERIWLMDKWLKLQCPRCSPRGSRTGASSMSESSAAQS